VLNVFDQIQNVLPSFQPDEMTFIHAIMSSYQLKKYERVDEVILNLRRNNYDGKALFSPTKISTSLSKAQMLYEGSMTSPRGEFELKLYHL
jgi:hypothetical protein